MLSLHILYALFTLFNIVKIIISNQDHMSLEAWPIILAILLGMAIIALNVIFWGCSSFFLNQKKTINAYVQWSNSHRKAN